MGVAVKARIVGRKTWTVVDGESLDPMEAAQAIAAEDFSEGDDCFVCGGRKARVEVVDDEGQVSVWSVVPVISFEAFQECEEVAA